MRIAIFNRGMSKPLFRQIKCVSKHLSDFNHLLWLDLAGAHYSKEAIAWMDENVYFVDKESNPQARPIENFWGCLEQKVYKGG